MQIKSAVLLTASLAAQRVAATGWTDASAYSCPGNTNNTCSSSQRGGYSWGGLKTGAFSTYGSNQFSGFTCANSPAKRDRISKRAFQSKCITGNLDDGPSMSGDSFSIDQMQISSSQDTDIDCHYGMPDGSTCTESHSCSSGGSIFQNTQCGGAKSVTFKPGKNAPSGCTIGVHSVGFQCSSASTQTSTHSKTSTSTLHTTTSTSTHTVSSHSSKSHSSKSQSTYQTSTSQGTTVTAQSASTSSASSQTQYSAPPVTFSSSPACYGSKCSSSKTSHPSSSNSKITHSTTSPSVYTTTSPSTSTTTTPSTSTTTTPSTSTTTSSSVYTTTSPSVTTTTSSSVVSATSTPSPSPYMPNCPDVLPRCLKTWMFITDCVDNSDTDCFCANEQLIKNVMECLSAWSPSQNETAAAASYLMGLCADQVPNNPAIITACPSGVSVGPQTTISTGTVTTQSCTTLTFSSTVTVQATYSTGVSSGLTCSGSSITTTLVTTVTVPKVSLITSTVTVQGSTSSSVGLGAPCPKSTPATTTATSNPAPFTTTTSSMPMMASSTSSSTPTSSSTASAAYTPSSTASATSMNSTYRGTGTNWGSSTTTPAASTSPITPETGAGATLGLSLSSFALVAVAAFGMW